jgi:hypothetical protein
MCDEAQKTENKVSMPWRTHPNVSGKDAAMRNALQVLYMLHLRRAYENLPIDIIMDAAKNVKWVEATDSIKAGDFVLPPCVTNATQLRTECTHPCKVPIRVTVLATSADAVEAEKTTAVAVVEGKTGRPKQAKKQCRDTAVAEGAGTAVADVKEEYTFLVTPEWVAAQYKEESNEWKWHGGETMHPFWGVRRAS